MKGEKKSVLVTKAPVEAANRTLSYRGDLADMGGVVSDRGEDLFTRPQETGLRLPASVLGGGDHTAIVTRSAIHKFSRTSRHTLHPTTTIHPRLKPAPDKTPVI